MTFLDQAARRIRTMKETPKGIYLVAVVFFFTGLLCIADLLPRIFYLFGFERDRGLLWQPGYLWVLLGGLLLSWLLCYGDVAMTRLRPAPQWIFFAMTLFLIFRFMLEPAANSAHRITLPRVL